jgi:hypothetical protein
VHERGVPQPAARSHTWQPTTVPLPQHATGNGHPQHPAHTPPCPSRGHSLRFGAIVFPVTVTVTQRPHGSHSGGSATSTGQRALDMPCRLTLALGMSTPGKCEQSPRIVFRERTRDVLRYLPWYPIRVCIIPPVIAHRLRLAQTLVTHDIRHCFRPCSNFELPRFNTNWRRKPSEATRHNAIDAPRSIAPDSHRTRKAFTCQNASSIPTTDDGHGRLQMKHATGPWPIRIAWSSRAANYGCVPRLPLVVHEEPRHKLSPQHYTF